MAVNDKINASQAGGTTGWYPKLRNLQSKIGESQTPTPSSIATNKKINADSIQTLISNLSAIHTASDGSRRTYLSYASISLPTISQNSKIEWSVASNIDTAISRMDAININNVINTQGVVCSKSGCGDSWGDDYQYCGNNDWNWSPCGDSATVWQYGACPEEGNWKYSTGGNSTCSKTYHTQVVYYTGYKVKSSTAVGSCGTNTCIKKL